MAVFDTQLNGTEVLEHPPHISFDATIEGMLKEELGGVRLAETVARDEQLLRAAAENLDVRSVDAGGVGGLR